MSGDLGAALHAHDRAVRAVGLTVPVGVELTAGGAPVALAAAVDVEPLWRAAEALWAGDAAPAGAATLLLGGPTAGDSAFQHAPHLLPGLVRFVNRHPALSYWLAGDRLGSAGPAPRLDEGEHELFEELAVALDRIAARGDAATLADVAAGLGPLLSPRGERADLGVERTFSGGVLAVRALVAPATAAHLAAAAALWRAVAVRLAVSPFGDALVDWSGSLHERFALPLFLEEDLRAVFEELAEHGVGLPPPVVDLLLDGPGPLAHVELGEAVLSVSAAREFQPRLPDGTVDTSSARVQVLVRLPEEQTPGTVWVCGHEVPLSAVGRDNAVVFHVAGIRYRATPSAALHPDLAPHDPLAFVWQLADEAIGIEVRGAGAQRRATVVPAAPRAGGGGPRVAASMRELAARFGMLEQMVQPDSGFTIDLRRR